MASAVRRIAATRDQPALLELVAGLVIGLWIGPLGIAAAIGLALLMIGAVIYHIKARDTAKNTMSPLILLLLSATVLALQAASL